MADGIITPCNVVRSWHWFRHVTASCNAPCGSGIMTVNSPSGSTLQYDTWLWDDMPLNSPGGSTLQCDRWLWDACHVICPNVRYIGILYLVSILTISPQSTCHSAPVCEILSKSDYPQQKKITSCWFSRWRISTILNFSGPVMGSLKSPYTTSYRSSIDIRHQHSSKLLSFWENCLFVIWRQTDRQTDEQMDTPVAWCRPLSVSRAAA